VPCARFVDRCRQCFRRRHDTGSNRHLLNAGKVRVDALSVYVGCDAVTRHIAQYSTAFVVTTCSLLLISYKSTPGMLELWIVAMFVSGTYNATFDLLGDFGLWRKRTGAWSGAGACV
jgi:hypothetical protein